MDDHLQSLPRSRLPDFADARTASVGVESDHLLDLLTDLVGLQRKEDRPC